MHEKIALYTDYVETEIPESDGDTLRESFYWEPSIVSEIKKVFSTKRCPYCKWWTHEHYEGGAVFHFCSSCGYYAGQGYGSRYSPGLYGVASIIKSLDLSSDKVSNQELIEYLNRIPQRLLELSPFRAEKVVMDVIAEALRCEVRAMGGRRDGGVDGYIIANDSFKTIIQVKWHQNPRKAESVQVVREVAGTMLARQVPHALIVSTRRTLSATAKNEIGMINGLTVREVGNLQIDVKLYADILSMFNLAARRVSSLVKDTEYLWRTAGEVFT